MHSFFYEVRFFLLPSTKGLSSLLCCNMSLENRLHVFEITRVTGTHIQYHEAIGHILIFIDLIHRREQRFINTPGRKLNFECDDVMFTFAVSYECGMELNLYFAN